MSWWALTVTFHTSKNLTLDFLFLASSLSVVKSLPLTRPVGESAKESASESLLFLHFSTPAAKDNSGVVSTTRILSLSSVNQGVATSRSRL